MTTMGRPCSCRYYHSSSSRYSQQQEGGGGGGDVGKEKESKGSFGFSSSWQNVDTISSTGSNSKSSRQLLEEEEEYEEKLGLLHQHTPNPIQYLDGFDSVPEVGLYKQALLNACGDIQPGHRILDVGCGTATHVPKYIEKLMGTTTTTGNDKIGGSGHMACIDISQDILNVAKERNEDCMKSNLVTFEVQDIYDTRYKSNTFDIIKEDRVLQHLNHPKEAIYEMLRICKPNGTIVVSEPDFRSFTIDHYQSSSTLKSHNNELSSSSLHSHYSWKYYDKLTTKVLNGVIPTLCVYPNIGLSLPQLLYDVGCNDVELYEIVSIPLIGLENLEKVVPVTYMGYLSYVNGAITHEELTTWLDYLKGRDEELFGILNMYICRGRKPSMNDGDINNNRMGDDDLSHGSASPVTSTSVSVGKKMFTNKPRNKVRYDVATRFATLEDDNLQAITDLINDAYATSDTGITLTSTRVELKHVIEMVQRNEILVAYDDNDNDTDIDMNEPVGCLQVVIKTKDNNDTDQPPHDSQNDEEEQKKQHDGWPVDEETTNKIADFSCFAVTRNIYKDGKIRKGIGTALLYKAEAYARSIGCTKMQLAILCPAADPEPRYKVWLQSYYRKHEYRYQKTIYLKYEIDDTTGKVIYDELHEMHEPLHQLVPCKAIIMDKVL